MTEPTGTLSPFQSDQPKKASNVLGYAPNEMVNRWAKHVFGHKMFIIRRLESSIDKEAYQARYLNTARELVIDVFYPSEFNFVK